MRAPPRFTKSASSLTSQSRDSHNPDGRNSWLNGDARPSWSAQPATTPSTPVSQPRHPRRNHWRATCAERRMRWFGRRALLCPEFRRTQGSVTGSCRVFIRYGRIRHKIGIRLANSRYTDNSEPRLDDDGFTISVADGILINEILHDILDAAEQLGITGQVEFINLNGYARKKLADGDRIAVKAINGHIFHVSNNRQLSQTPNRSEEHTSELQSLRH